MKPLWGFNLRQLLRISATINCRFQVESRVGDRIGVQPLPTSFRCALFRSAGGSNSHFVGADPDYAAPMGLGFSFWIVSTNMPRLRRFRFGQNENCSCNWLDLSLSGLINDIRVSLLRRSYFTIQRARICDENTPKPGRFVKDVSSTLLRGRSCLLEWPLAL
jgi:hypothetical protein